MADEVKVVPREKEPEPEQKAPTQEELLAKLATRVISARNVQARKGK